MMAKVGDPIVIDGTKYRIRRLERFAGEILSILLIAKAGPSWRRARQGLMLVDPRLAYDRTAGVWRVERMKDQRPAAW